MFVVDTAGLLPRAPVHPADIRDRDGRVLVVKMPLGRHPFSKEPFADDGYRGPVLARGQ
jgi:hypothetical protein